MPTKERAHRIPAPSKLVVKECRHIRSVEKELEGMCRQVIDLICINLSPFAEVLPIGPAKGSVIQNDRGCWLTHYWDHHLPFSSGNVVTVSFKGVRFYSHWNEWFEEYSRFCIEDLLAIEEFSREIPKYDKRQMTYAKTGQDK